MSLLTRSPVSRRHRNWLVVGAVALLFLAAIAAGIRWRASRSMQAIVAESLHANVTAHHAAIASFFDDLIQSASADSLGLDVESAAVARLTELMPTDSTSEGLGVPIIPPVGAVGWVLLDLHGFVVASDRNEFRNQTLPTSRQSTWRLESGQPTVILLPPTIKLSGNATGRALVIARPVRQGQRVCGAIGWVVDASLRITRLLSFAKLGQSDDSFVVDPRGELLTRRRVESRPVAASEAIAAASTMPPRATVGVSGSDVVGYPNERGEPVVAAWRWCEEWEWMLVTEQNRGEAMAALDWLSWLTVGGLVVSLVGALAFALAALGERWAVPTTLAGRSIERRLGQYQLTQLIGVGGMGAVYRGRHQFLRRDVAIKVLEGDRLSPQSIQRFRREVQLTSTLRHPNTIAIFDYGHTDSATNESRDGQPVDADSTFYYVMEYVDGISLQQLIERYGPQSPERTIHLLIQICGSISEAHQAGLIHRDIKPANVLVNSQEGCWDHVKVLDFGLVKEIDRSGDSTLDESMTRVDSITGTPLYMAPETIRDATAANPLSDVYSIGAVGYALLTGKPTFRGESAIDLCLKQLEALPPRPEIRLGRPLPRLLQDCVMQCLAISPAKRPGSVAELADGLLSLPEANRWTIAESQQWWETVYDRQQVAAAVTPNQKTCVDEPIGQI